MANEKENGICCNSKNDTERRFSKAISQHVNMSAHIQASGDTSSCNVEQSLFWLKYKCASLHGNKSICKYAEKRAETELKKTVLPVEMGHWNDVPTTI